jgi:dienelactone hydrolase
LAELQHIETSMDGNVIPLSNEAANQLSGSWPDRSYEIVRRLELHVYKVTKPKAQALIYPGGGYLKLMHDKEGVEVALWLNSLSIDAYVVTHRLPGSQAEEGLHPKDIALTDSLSCLDYLHKNSPHLPLFHVGLSSGGHLAGVMACQNHPLAAKGAIIAYAPVNANHRDYKAPAGKPDYPPVEKQAFYDDWPIGIAAIPHGMPNIPLFLAYALHDQSVPVDHVLNLIRSARQAKREVDAHIFGTAPHGFALRDKSGTHASWASLAEQWIERHL